MILDYIILLIMENEYRQIRTISIVIPVYNEKDYIRQALRSVVAAPCEGLLKEIIIIDDGSTDGTTQILETVEREIKPLLAAIRATMKIIIRNKNQGKGAALQLGFMKTKGDIVIIQDADLEYDPDEYPAMLEPFLKHQADVVYGSRFISQKPHRVLLYWHSLANKILTTLSNMLTNINLTDMETGYKAFQGDLIRGLAPKLTSQRFGFEPEITSLVAKIPNIKIYEVGVSYWGRGYSEGKKITWRDGVRAIREIITFNLFR